MIVHLFVKQNLEYSNNASTDSSWRIDSLILNAVLKILMGKLGVKRIDCLEVENVLKQIMEKDHRIVTEDGYHYGVR